MTQPAATLARLMRDARTAVVFTGAGVSTDSGIPDFRSPGGIWTRMKPIDFGDYIASEDVRVEAWRRKFEMDKTLQEAKPNDGHTAIAHLVEMGKVGFVITQNVDDLHRVSGVPSERIIELHGNATYALCLECRGRFEMAELRQRFMETQRPPYCDVCGGIVKTATISFGQPMPEDEMRRAQDAASACDVFLSIGSSLQVYPAAGIPLLAKRAGASLVILNREETPLDAVADHVFHEEISSVLSKLSELVQIK